MSGMVWPIGVTVGLEENMQARMRDLEENGIRHIELSRGDPASFSDFRERSREIFRVAAEHGVRVRSVHLPFAPFEAIDPASLDGDVRARWLSVESELLSVAAARGAELVVVHPSGEPYAEEKRAEHLSHAIESIGALCEIAKRGGVKLAVENLPRTCICRDCKEIKAMGRALPDIFFCFDANHSLVDQNVDIIRSMGERIIALHISDYDRVNERHWLPGLGVNDWQGIRAALEEVHYTGTWNYELRDSASIPACEMVENHRAIFEGRI